MVREHPFVTRVGPRVPALAVAAATLALFLSSPVAVAAGQQQKIIEGNNSLCRAINVDGNVEDGRCLAIANAQPPLEGFEMASDPGSAVNLTHMTISYRTFLTNNPGKAACGRDKGSRYFSCTTLVSKKIQLKCDQLKRDCLLH